MKLILHLNLKKKWFDMIKSGEKTEEYRDIKPHWDRIFYIVWEVDNHYTSYITIKGELFFPEQVTICFSNGYAKNRPQTFKQCTGLRIGKGRKEWGASGENQYILKLKQITGEDDD